MKKNFSKGEKYLNKMNYIDKDKLNKQVVLNNKIFDKKLISLIIPSYNYGIFLSEAVESVLRQTILPDEILIVDDCSSDNTEQIGRYYSNQYPNLIKFHRNEENLGIIKNFNNAVKQTSGDFICFLGADNRFKFDYIEKTSNILLNNDDVAIAYTDFELFGDRAKIVYDGFLEERKGKIINNEIYIINFPDFDRELLKSGNYIHGSSMYRRIAFEQVGGYKNIKDSPEDYNLFYRIIMSGWNAKRVPEALLEYRQHSEEQANIKNINISKMNFYKNQNIYLTSIIEKRDNDILQLKKEIKKRDQEIELLKSIVNHRDNDIEVLEFTVNQKMKDIEELQQALNYRINDVEELKKIIEIKDEKLNNPIMKFMSILKK